MGCSTPGPSEDERDALVFRNLEAAFVGDDSCFSCHEEAYTGYQEHGMAHSFYPLTAENRVEDIQEVFVHHAETGLSYTIVEEGGAWYQEEFRTDPDGRTTHRLRRRMDYVIGSGHAARTYLTESNGRLFELPLTWYTQKKQWDFSPGYATKNGRFDRLIPDGCMACHNSYPEGIPFVEGKYTAVPEGIGCERCHGPGALHVEERLAMPEPAADIDDSIVNPAHLSPERRLDVCNQCHLQTTVSVLREGRSAFSFRPSEALRDHLGFFVAHGEESSNAVEVVSHAERMQQGACFTATVATERALECTTCHNPHEGFREAGPGYFNDTCLGCHDAETLPAAVASDAEPHDAASNCIACHMPKVAVSDAPHSSFTDHWIRVVEAEASAAPEDPDADIMEPYYERDRGNREGQRYLGMALVVHGRQQNNPRLMATGAATLEVGLAADTTHGEAHFLLGVAHQQLGNLDQAVPALERAVRIDAGIPQRLNALAQAYEAVGRDGAVVERLYQRALQLQPALADIRVNYGHFMQTQGRTEEALAAYDAALAEQPWLDIAALKRCLAFLEDGRRAEAGRTAQDAVGLNPAYDEILRHILFYQTQQVGNAQVLSLIGEGAASDTQAVRIRPHPSGVRFTNLSARATVQVYTRNGVLVRTLERREPSSPLLWDLRSATGTFIPTGLYLVHVRAADANGRTLDTTIFRWAAVRQNGG